MLKELQLCSYETNDTSPFADRTKYVVSLLMSSDNKNKNLLTVSL